MKFTDHRNDNTDHKNDNIDLRNDNTNHKNDNTNHKNDSENENTDHKNDSEALLQIIVGAGMHEANERPLALSWENIGAPPQNVGGDHLAGGYGVT